MGPHGAFSTFSNTTYQYLLSLFFSPSILSHHSQPGPQTSEEWGVTLPILLEEAMVLGINLGGKGSKNLLDPDLGYPSATAQNKSQQAITSFDQSHG